MADDANPVEKYPDSFAGIARYYNAMMQHVDYDRWFRMVTLLAELAPIDFRHLDAACGTGVLLKKLRHAGWRSFGLDYSFNMIQHGFHNDSSIPAAVGDLRRLPVQSIDFITCLFDSINFLLCEEDLRQTIQEFARALNDGGLLYFDLVTERMIKEHYAGQKWTEQNHRFSTTWDNAYSFETGIIETRVRINFGQETILKERVYSMDTITQILDEAGLNLLGVYDAYTWKRSTSKSLRIDVVASKGHKKEHKKKLDAINRNVRLLSR